MPAGVPADSLRASVSIRQGKARNGSSGMLACKLYMLFPLEEEFRKQMSPTIPDSWNYSCFKP
jgi:hypothetical protein